MQINTTGQFMIEFLDMFLIFAFSVSIIANMAFILHLKRNKKSCDKIINDHPVLFQDIKNKLEVIDSVTTEINRSLLELKDSIQPIKPSIRPNNWDSMRHAFKAPTKVAIDE